jgi:hypothetical protein
VCKGHPLIGRMTPLYGDRDCARSPYRRGRFPAGGAGDPAGEILCVRISLPGEAGDSAGEAGASAGKRQSKLECLYHLFDGPVIFIPTFCSACSINTKLFITP